MARTTLAERDLGCTTYHGDVCEMMAQAIVQNITAKCIAKPYEICTGDIDEDAQYFCPLDPQLFTKFQSEGYTPDVHGRKDTGEASGW